MESSSVTEEHEFVGSTEELIRIHEAFQEILETHRKTSHPLSSMVVDWQAHVWLRDLLGSSNVVGFRDPEGNLIGIICYEVSEFPLGPYKVLNESLVLSLKNTAGFGRVALEALERFAKELGCRAIHSGNALSLNQKLTENLYTRKGSFSFSHQNFIKTL